MNLRGRHRPFEAPAPTSDLTVVKRAGRVAAVQASVALALVLLVVGGVVFTVYARAQDRQISARLQSLAETADDAYDPPPDMELALRETDGRISTSDGAAPVEVCAGSWAATFDIERPVGFTAMNIVHIHRECKWQSTADLRQLRL